MTISRKQEERETRKKLILNSALIVFKTKGLEHSTMDEIAQEADFGKATLYYYFKSKEEIFNKILINGWTTLWDGIEDVVIEKNTPRRKFIKIIKKIIELVNEDRALYEFLFFAPQSYPSSSDIDPEWKQYQVKLLNTIHKLWYVLCYAITMPQVLAQYLPCIYHAITYGIYSMAIIPQAKKSIISDTYGVYFLP